MDATTDRRIPRLQSHGYDALTGTVAPPGRRWREEAEATALPQMGRLQSLSAIIVEMADFWQPGDPDCGITISPSDGRILPRVDHVRCVIPLTDVLGAQLAQSDTEKEMLRRDWYAAQMRSKPRLTPVHHIIGASDVAWHGSMRQADQGDRQAWLSMLWEPAALAKLMDTYRGIYAIDWQRLPEERILAPLLRKLPRMQERHDGKAAATALKLQRGRSELKVIQTIAAYIAAGDMTRAEAAHTQLSEIAKVYAGRIGPLESLPSGLLE